MEIEVKVDARSCMTSVERNQLLLTAPEVSFEITISLACSWSIVLYFIAEHLSGRLLIVQCGQLAFVLYISITL